MNTTIITFALLLIGGVLLGLLALLINIAHRLYIIEKTLIRPDEITNDDCPAFLKRQAD